MKRRLTLALITLLLTLGFTSAAAYADSVTFTLTNSSQSTPSASSITYAATITADAGNSGDIFLNSDSFNVPAPLGFDDTDFFLNFPFFLAPGQSFTGDLFVISVPSGSGVGDFTGTFTLLGGADGSAQDTLGTVNFNTTITPEPSSFLLLGTGLTSAFAVLNRKRLRTSKKLG
jgi:hypothetical protein